MPLMRSTFVLCIALLSALDAAEAATTRHAFNPSNLNKESIEVDLVSPCANRTSCSVEIAQGVTVKVQGGTQATFVPVNAPDGLIGDDGKAALKLPANGCVDASPNTIDAFAWKAGQGQQKISLTDYDASTSTFTGETEREVENSVYTFGGMSGKPSRFCIKPRGNTPFAVLWVKVSLPNTAEAKGNMSFSANMKRASGPLLASVTQALGEARTLANPDSLMEVICTDVDTDCTAAQKAQIDATISKLGPLISTLEAAQAALDPEKNGTSSQISVAHPRVRWALRGVQSAYKFVEPNLLPLASNPPRIRKKDRENPGVAVLVSAVSFQRNLQWLRADLESFEIYGDEGSSNSVTALLSQMLTDRLASIRTALNRSDTPTAADAPPPVDYNELLGALQTPLVALRQAALSKGDASVELVGPATQFSEMWNSEAIQTMASVNLRNSSVRRDFRLLIDLIQGLTGLPCAKDLRFSTPSARSAPQG